MKKYFAFLLLPFYFCLISCSSSKKFKSKTTEKTTVNTELSQQTIDVQQTDSSSVTYEDSSFTNTSILQINFDTAYYDQLITPNDQPAPNFSEKENDYEAATPKKQKAVVGKTQRLDFTYNINGNIINSQVPIKNINLVDKKTGKTSAVQMQNINRHDSTASNTQSKVQTSTETITTTKQKKTTSHLWILVVIACIIVGWLLYQIPIVNTYVNLFFALFKPRKKTEPPAP